MGPDRDLAQRYRRGDDDAFMQLWRLHEASFHRQARRCGHEDVAREAVAELCSRLLQPAVRQSYSGHSNWRSWAGAILNGILADMFRRRAAERRALNVLAEFPRTDPSGTLTPWDWQQFRADVKACVSELPDMLRAVILDHYFEGRSRRELAQVYGNAHSESGQGGDQGAYLRVCRLLNKSHDLVKRCLEKKGYGTADL